MNIYIIKISNLLKEHLTMTVSENKKRIMISLTETQNNELEELAKKRGFSKSAIVALAIDEYKKGEK